MKLILVSVNQLIKIPRCPPGPCYVAKDINSNSEELGINSKSLMAEKKLMLLHLNEEEMEKQAEALFLIQKLTKP